MTFDRPVNVTRKQIKADAKALLSKRDVLLKLILCGAFYIAVLIMFEIFSSYAFSAIFYNVLEESELQRYSLIFEAVCVIPHILLIYPLFVGLWRVTAKLANGASAEFVEIFTYYGSFKKLRRAWMTAVIFQLPLAFVEAIMTLLQIVTSDSILIKIMLSNISSLLSILYFFLSVFIFGRLFPFINSVVCGGDQPVSLCFKASFKATRGKMWKLFAFYLSFIPWILLSLLTVGVLFIIFTFPYMLVAECLYSKYLLTGEYRTNTTEETL